MQHDKIKIPEAQTVVY